MAVPHGVAKYPHVIKGWCEPDPAPLEITMPLGEIERCLLDQVIRDLWPVWEHTFRAVEDQGLAAEIIFPRTIARIRVEFCRRRLMANRLKECDHAP